MRESPQGWIPRLASPEDVRGALDRAFDYRGDVTLTLKNGERLEGFIFDRSTESPSLSDWTVRLIPKDASGRVTVRFGDIAGLEFTGRDMAAGTNFDAWLQRYHEKRARGDQNIKIEPEPLD